MQSLGTAQQLVFDGRSLRTVENGVFSWAFRASAKHTLEQQQQRAAVGSADAARMWSSLSTFLTEQQALAAQENGTSASANTQRRILWRLDSSDAEVHVAQSNLRFELVHDSAVRVKCDFGRTGWRHREESAEDVAATPSKEISAPLPPRATRVSESALKLVILGTGSAAPSKLRGSTAMYLELPRSRAPASQTARDDDNVAVPDALLIDCGEGTFGQLWRQFGDETAARIGALRCVWISHSHADHQCGLVRVLYEYARFHARREAAAARQRVPFDRQVLVVVAPLSVISYARSWTRRIADACGITEGSTHVAFAACREFNDRRHPLRAELLTQIGSVVAQLSSVPVHHCYDAYGLVVELRDGRKIVYSGDTRPCSALVAAGASPGAFFLSCWLTH